MSCWVVPSLAADLWHIPLEQLWSRIREGKIAVREEDGFTFVDMAPSGPHLHRSPTPTQERPETFTFSDAGEHVEADDEMGPEDETASVKLGDWRVARIKAGKLRIPPPRRQPLPA